MGNVTNLLMYELMTRRVLTCTWMIKNLTGGPKQNILCCFGHLEQMEANVTLVHANIRNHRQRTLCFRTDTVSTEET